MLLSNSPNHFVLNGTVLRVSASVQYSLPISALDELLVTVSEGHLRGQVIVSQGVGHSEEGVVGVFIHASAEKRSVLEESTVCLRRTQKDDDGTWTSEIGISVSFCVHQMDCTHRTCNLDHSSTRRRAIKANCKCYD